MKLVRSLMLFIGVLAFSVGAYVRHVEAQQRQCNIPPYCYSEPVGWGSCVTFNYFCTQCYSGPFNVCITEYGTCTFSGVNCQYKFCSDVCQGN